MLPSLKDILPLGGFGKAGGPGMFPLADPGRIRDLVTTGRFSRVEVQHIEAAWKRGADARTRRPSSWAPAPDDHLLDQVAPPPRDAARQALAAALQRHETNTGGVAAQQFLAGHRRRRRRGTQLTAAGTRRAPAPGPAPAAGPGTRIIPTPNITDPGTTPRRPTAIGHRFTCTPSHVVFWGSVGAGFGRD
ncbi:hypothetical protein AB0M92_24515 [Streptomyces sp. NPDC051582]|uniref:hypothetical protein n=1 Tax=Streptomyces sp. NPDC051582 TaxID=3155167 RepID=UPI003447044B